MKELMFAKPNNYYLQCYHGRGVHSVKTNIFFNTQVIYERYEGIIRSNMIKMEINLQSSTNSRNQYSK